MCSAVFVSETARGSHLRATHRRTGKAGNKPDKTAKLGSALVHILATPYSFVEERQRFFGRSYSAPDASASPPKLIDHPAAKAGSVDVTFHFCVLRSWHSLSRQCPWYCEFGVSARLSEQPKAHPVAEKGSWLGAWRIPATLEREHAPT